MSAFLIACLAAALALLFSLWTRHIKLRREAFIRDALLPKGLFERLRKHHPELTPKDCQLVANGLRQFFLTHLKSGRQHVAMPSQVVDDLWHEFILYTKNYDAFCARAFGRFLHHTPAVVLTKSKQNNGGLRRCWWYACREEHINPRAATRLPLLFAIDAKLGIKDGFHYVADCGAIRRAGDAAGGSSTSASPYCGADFSDASVDGGLDGFTDASSDSGGSDGGGGDGGGCGGGGD
jgi:hypothetical protein